MKKITFCSVLFGSLILSGCNFALDEKEAVSPKSENYAYIQPTETRNLVYSSETEIFALDAATKSVTISGDIAGKTIYYAQVNKSNSYPLSKDYVRYVSNASSQRSAIAIQKLEDADVDSQDEHLHNAYEFHPDFLPETARASSYITPASKTHLTYNVGTTKKVVNVLSENSAYARKTTTLWAYNDVCNVWVVDNDPYITSIEKSVIAKNYAKRFEEIYPMIRKVFGEESDSIYSSVWGNKAPLNNVSDTGTKVNIVICDLYDDGMNGHTVGLFSSMDYYMNGLEFSNITIQNSNEGKYFYIDTCFAVKKFNLTISTLAHEFQHMINFGMKAMNGIFIDSNFNEMLSMLCEDMMQKYLGIKDADSPKARLSQFLNQYYQTGFRSFESTTLSYANAYTLGAWISRQFGGAGLIHEMMINGLANNDCIINAVNKVNGTNYTFDEIFSQFVMACLGENEYSFNKNAAQTIHYNANGVSYDYPMAAIYLERPRISRNEFTSRLSNGYGLFIKTYMTVSNDDSSVTMNFDTLSGMTNTGMTTYIYIK